MSEPLQGSNASASGPSRQGSFRWGWMLAVAGVIVAILILMPLLLPGVAHAISETSVHSYWYISRASAFVAFVLLWLSMLTGLGVTSNLSRIWPGMPTSFELPRFTSLLGRGFAAIPPL